MINNKLEINIFIRKKEKKRKEFIPAILLANEDW